MAQETALYRDDVEQVRRRWAEWRSTHAVRSRLPEELWAAAVELVQRDGIDATARALDVDKPSLRKWAGRLNPAAPQPSSAKVAAQAKSECPAGIRGVAGIRFRHGDELSGGSRVAARCEAAAGVEGHSDQRTGGADSRVCGHVSMLQITPQMRILVAVEAVDFRKGIDSLAELCRAKLNADPFSGCLFVFRSRRATSIKCWSTTGRDFGWRPSVCPKDAFAGGRRWQNKEPRNLPGRCACIKRRCCSRRATRTWMPLRCGAK